MFLSNLAHHLQWPTTLDLLIYKVFKKRLHSCMSLQNKPLQDKPLQSKPMHSGGWMLRTNFSHHTCLYFVGNPHHINIIMDFKKISFKAQKSPYLHKKTSKPMVQNPSRYYIIKAHGSISWHNISFLAHDPSSWVSSGEFWGSWFGGPSSMFS